ncbi:Uncharacterized protein TCAP_06522 [Tolypocladium capitatum]|uniref:Uncharacterized protein n=1 Tax=Tolypocladium capitatum TaxID=45235 RepID=A0A2K3Q7R9_9HYPO|nr:Uncharacterized protein TCAP_06522 [Tolypocladium capitatum]
MRVGPPPRTLKVVSEPHRERETFKYDPSLLTSIKYNDSSDGQLPSSELVTSDDTILTALAQLGACQTSTSRSLISLFDQSHQYIVAEATPTLPLVPSLRHQDRDEDLWLCGTAIPRQYGMCEHSLCGVDPSDGELGAAPSHLPLSLVPDLQTDPRFASKPYCRPGSPARFYAAVPIRTQGGINIGVYCVIDARVRHDWDDRRTQLMLNISRSIMNHLDARRSAANLRRGVRMSRGIASFVEGDAAVSAWHDGPNQVAFRDSHGPEGVPNANQQALQNGRGDLADPVAAENVADQLPGRQTPPTAIFSGAARIIRESIEVEGCLFLDARVTSFGRLSRNAGSNDWSRPHGAPSSHSGSDDSNASPVGEASAWCDVLGSSTSDASGTNRHASMPERLVSKLLRRYPKGRIFSFDAKGELQSSDSSEDDPNSQTPADHGQTDSPRHSPPATSHQRQPWARHREGTAVLATFPGARSVAFVPLWDAKKERWGAACFAYTHTPTRILTMDSELSYLRAFGMLAMSEVCRLDTQLASKAKSDVLGAISHELRSPLHGVILGVELLNDTDVSAFQGNILHTIETCGRTLKDTIDHLLDFAKINNYTTSKRNQGIMDTKTRDPQPRRTGSIETGMMSLYSDVRVDDLAEEVIESVFAGYNFQYASVAQLQKHRAGLMRTDVHANRRLDSLHAMDELGPALTAQGDIRLDFGKVCIFLDIDPSCSWTFYTQPGAVRRVLMNIFGNSLKYTSRGAITIRLRQEAPARKLPGKEQMVKMTITDTGRGIGDDFLRNDLFKPFLQEDQLSPGTGLGLSIVKQIISQLDGSISVQSRLGIGTTVSVSLPMGQNTPSPVARTAEPVDDQDFEKHVRELKGLRVRLLGFDEDKSQARCDSKYGRPEIVCQDWLRMEVISQPQDEQAAADLLLVSEHVLPQFEELSGSDAPVVVVCTNALAAYHYSTLAERMSTARVFEFISQPTGPRKLAKIFGIAFKRWIDLQALPATAKKAAATANLEQYGSLSSIISPPTLNATNSGGGRDASTQVSEDLEEGTKACVDTNPAQPLTMAMKSAQRRTLSGFAACDIPRSPLADKEDLQFLLVDDNHINIKILASYAKKLGRKYHIATNGREAVDAYLVSPDQYCCIFMDISMPVMDGFEATRCIRSFEHEKQLKPTKIFALTGLASIGAQQEALESGIDLFLTKPVRLKELGTILLSKELL